MGANFTKFCADLCKKKHIKALVLGLNGVGKTSFINRYKSRQLLQTEPTQGIKVETLQLKHVRLTVWDVGRQQNLDKILTRYYAETSVVIYVVDASDRKRINKAKEQLAKLLKQQQLQTTSLLIIANKKDIKDSMSVAEVCEKMDLLDLKNRHWLIQGTSAITGQGVYQCFGWLNQVNQRQQ